MPRLYVEVFRNIPIIVQMFLWYFVLPELLPERLGTCNEEVGAAVGGLFPGAGGVVPVHRRHALPEQVKAGIEAPSLRPARRVTQRWA